MKTSAREYFDRAAANWDEWSTSRPVAGAVFKIVGWRLTASPVGSTPMCSRQIERGVSMSVQSVTLNVPRALYDRLERRAAQTHRTVEEIGRASCRERGEDGGG